MEGNPRKHGIDVVPPRVVGSPADLPPPPPDALMPGGNLFNPSDPWWEPGPVDVAKALGWRWILIVLLLMALTGLVALVFLIPGIHASHAANEIKLALLLIGAGISLIGYVTRRLVRLRRDLFCIHCGYTVEGLEPIGRCPECGRWYHAAVIEEYKKDHRFFQARYRAIRRLPPRPGAIMAGPVPNPDDGTS